MAGLWLVCGQSQPNLGGVSTTIWLTPALHVNVARARSQAVCLCGYRRVLQFCVGADSCNPGDISQKPGLSTKPTQSVYVKCPQSLEAILVVTTRSYLYEHPSMEGFLTVGIWLLFPPLDSHVSSDVGCSAKDHDKDLLHALGVPHP